MLALRLLSEGGQGPDTSLSWLLYIGIAFFVMIIIFGWPEGSRKQSQPAGPREAPRGKKKADDLVKIEGIGPKVAKVLNEAGITTFDDLARAKAADLQKTINSAGFQMMNSEGWIAQAKLAAKGEWDELEDLQDELKGGRKAK